MRHLPLVPAIDLLIILLVENSSMALFSFSDTVINKDSTSDFVGRLGLGERYRKRICSVRGHN